MTFIANLNRTLARGIGAVRDVAWTQRLPRRRDTGLLAIGAVSRGE